jgi:hypothetical protein
LEPDRTALGASSDGSGSKAPNQSNEQCHVLAGSEIADGFNDWRNGATRAWIGRDLSIPAWRERDGLERRRAALPTLDPWTSEVLRVHCVGPSSPQCSAPTILDEAPDATP